jgi:hypothetical protein
VQCHQRIHHGDIDADTLTDLLSPPECPDSTECGKYAGGQVSEPESALYWGAVWKASEIHHPARGLNDAIVCPSLVINPEPGNVDADDPGIDFVHNIPAEAKAIHRTGCQVLHEYLALCEQAPEDVLTPVGLKIQYYTPFVAVKHSEIVFGVTGAAMEVEEVPHFVAAVGPLDLDDFGAHVA